MTRVAYFCLLGRGGMVHYSSQFVNAARLQVDVLVLLPSYVDRAKYFDVAERDVVRVAAPPTITGTLLSCLAFWKHISAIRRLRAFKPDVIHVMDVHPFYGLYLRFLPGRVVFTQHDPVLHKGEQRSLKDRVTGMMNRWLARRADARIVHGKALEGDGGKVVVVPHGDYAFFRRWAKPGVKREKHTILFFGRIIEYKGLDLLIRAAELAAKNIPGLKVIIAGEGEFNQYKALIKTPALFEIHNGYIPEEEVPQYFQRCSAVVLPYKDGSQSGVVPVAYAFSRPVIVTPVGAIHEVVDDGKTGLIAEKTPEAIARAIENLLRDDKRAVRMGKEAYAKMERTMGWTMIAKKVVREAYGTKKG